MDGPGAVSKRDSKTGRFPARSRVQYPPREPFKVGNTVPMTHGANHAGLRDPIAASLVEKTMEQVPYLSDPRFAGELAAWARAEAAVILIERWLGKEGLEDGAGNLRESTLNQLAKFETTAARRREQLGLTPMAAARLDAIRSAQRQGDAVIELEDYLSKKREESDG